MKIFYVNTNDGTTFATMAIKENGVSCSELEVSDEEFEKITGKEFSATVVDGALQFTEVPKPEPSPDIARKEELKAKAEAGTITQEEILEALKLIL